MSAPPLPPTAWPRPIDPFAGSLGGRYEDEVVVVRRRVHLDARPNGRPNARPDAGPDQRWTAWTRHFALGRERGRLLLEHTLRLGEIDNDVTLALDEELFAPGWASGADTFERLLTGLVLSGHDDALTAWECFYRATLARLRTLVDGEPPEGGPTPDRPAPDRREPDRREPAEGTLAAFAPVYRHAEELVCSVGARSLLDLGTCFGFFPLRLAARGPAGLTVRAADLSPGTCELLARVSQSLGCPVPALVCDAACVPLPNAALDTVTLLHVLEHVDASHGQAILAEAVRLARRRVIVAVPLEAEPDPTFGHLRTISLEDLAASGAQLARGGSWRARVEEHHGGWLVLDRARTGPLLEHSVLTRTPLGTPADWLSATE